MKVAIKDDPSIVVAAQQFMQSDKEAACAFKQAARNHHVELMVNTVSDRKPPRPTVFLHHHRSPEHRELFLNLKTPVKRETRQIWATGAQFPNAHAFPDNPLRTAQDYLYR